MEDLKGYIVSWLDWGADYVREDPQDFLSKLMLLLLPLFILSGALAYFLIKQIDKDEKRKVKKNQVVKKAKKASSQNKVKQS